MKHNDQKHVCNWITYLLAWSQKLFSIFGRGFFHYKEYFAFEFILELLVEEKLIFESDDDCTVQLCFAEDLFILLLKTYFFFGFSLTCVVFTIVNIYKRAMKNIYTIKF